MHRMALAFRPLEHRGAGSSACCSGACCPGSVRPLAQRGSLASAVAQGEGAAAAVRTGALAASRACSEPEEGERDGNGSDGGMEPPPAMEPILPATGPWAESVPHREAGQAPHRPSSAGRHLRSTRVEPGRQEAAPWLGRPAEVTDLLEEAAGCALYSVWLGA